MKEKKESHQVERTWTAKAAVPFLTTTHLRAKCVIKIKSQVALEHFVFNTLRELSCGGRMIHSTVLSLGSLLFFTIINFFCYFCCCSSHLNASISVRLGRVRASSSAALEKEFLSLELFFFLIYFHFLISYLRFCCSFFSVCQGSFFSHTLACLWLN